MGYGNCSSGPAPSGKPWEGYYYSAYGIAVKHGFQGTEEEWLESLKAPTAELDRKLDHIKVEYDYQYDIGPEENLIAALNMNDSLFPVGASVVDIVTKGEASPFVSLLVNKMHIDSGGSALTVSTVFAVDGLRLVKGWDLSSSTITWKIIHTEYPKLNGKKIYIYGGSYSDPASAAYMQPNWVAAAESMLIGATIYNRAHKGHCIASIRKTTPTYGPERATDDFYYSISNMVLNETGTDADAIILFGGTNDYLQAKPLGAFGAATPDQETVCGALDLMAEKFHTIGPKAQVFVVTLPKLHPTTDRTAWESGKDYTAGIVRRITENDVTTNYKCIQAHTSSDANKPGSGADWATYWEVWTDRDLCPPIVLRTVLATWAAKNGYTLIDGYAFPLLNPYNDPYDFCADDGIHYKKAYSQLMAEYLLDKMSAGGDAALASDLTKIDVSGSPGSLFTPTSANAYYGSDGRVNLVVKGTSTTSAGKNIITLPAHLRPIESERCFARVEAGGTVYVAPCSINASTGTIAIAGVAATGSSNIEIKATYDTVFSGYNPDPA